MNPSDVVVVIPASLPGGEREEKEEERNLLSYIKKSMERKGEKNLRPVNRHRLVLVVAADKNLVDLKPSDSHCLVVCESINNVGWQ